MNNQIKLILIRDKILFTIKLGNFIITYIPSIVTTNDQYNYI